MPGGREEFTAPEAGGYGQVDRDIPELAPGEDDQFGINAAEGSWIRIDSLEMEAPPLGSSGVHGFEVHTRESEMVVLRIEADAGNGLWFQGVDWAVADRFHPGTYNMPQALDRAVGGSDPSDSISIRYYNDTDATQAAGNAWWNAVTKRGARS